MCFLNILLIHHNITYTANKAALKENDLSPGKADSVARATYVVRADLGFADVPSSRSLFSRRGRTNHCMASP